MLKDQSVWRTLVPIVDGEQKHPKLRLFRPVIRYTLSWKASKIIDFLKVLKTQPLDMCRSTSVLTGLSRLFSLMHVLHTCISPEFRNQNFSAGVFDGLLQEESKPLFLKHQHDTLGCY